MEKTLIKNAKIYDGSGAPAFLGDVLIEGERIVREILRRLKVPNKTIEHTAELTRWHMYDFNGETKENKLRKFFVEHFPLLPDLALLKQADFSGCKDDLSPCPTNVKWEKLQNKMKSENAPMTLKALAVNGKDLLSLGVQKQNVAKLLNKLLVHTAINPKDNTKERLLKLAAATIQGENL